MKDTYTKLETFQTSDGNTIIYDQTQVANFFKKSMEQLYPTLSKEEQEEWFTVSTQYDDLLKKVWKNHLDPFYSTEEPLRNPTEEYEFALATDKDINLTDEEHQIKLQRLLHFKTLFEQNQNG
jgi:hypothetical protein